MALIAMPAGASSRASATVICATAALVAQYKLRSRTPMTAATEEKLTILPRPAAFMRGATALIMLNVPFKFTSIMRSMSSVEVAPIGVAK
jgi:hypothetical protein